MVAYPYSTSQQLGVNLAVTQTVNTSMPEYTGPNFPPGTRVLATNGGGWTLCQAAAAALSVGQVVSFDINFNATPVTTANATGNSGALIGVCPLTAALSADYVWIQTAGYCQAILVSASTAANAQLYTTTTAGQLSATATSSVAINGVIITTAQGSGGPGTQAGTLNNPEILLTT